MVIHRLVVEPKDLRSADGSLTVASQNRSYGAGSEIECECVVLVGARHGVGPSAVEGTEGGAGPEVGALGLGGAEGHPGLGTQDPLALDVVHVDGDAQHRSQGDEVAPKCP